MNNLINNQKYIQNNNGKYTVFSGFPEFGYELIATLPYCYTLYKQGLLEKTISGFDTKCLYFFSPNHVEMSEKRSFQNVTKLSQAGFPNIRIHQNQLNWDYFTPPPLKTHYINKAILFDKPTIVIQNRVNTEWQGEPVNFLPVETILALSRLLSPKYQVVLIQSFDFTSNYEDHALFSNKHYIDEKTCIQLNIETLQTLKNKYENLSFNEIQCRLYAGCEKFISSNGGLGIFASYFGGENIIFSKMCYELDPDINSFYSWYYRFSKSVINVVNDEEELLSIVKSKWINNDTLFNIIIRTSNRPNYFHDCITSILDQNYKNYNIIVGVDDEKSIDYVRKHPCLIVNLKKNEIKKYLPPDDTDAYGVWFPFNDYFNVLQKYATIGYIIYLDDDDALAHSDVLSELNTLIQKSDPCSIFWRVQFPNRLVPNEENFALKIPVCKDIDTVGFCFKSSFKPTWEPFKRGDYRVASWIAKQSKKQIWHDSTFTKILREKEGGNGTLDDKPVINISKNAPLVVVISAFNAKKYLKDCLDSVFSELDTIPHVKSKVLLGIDGCAETLTVVKKFSRVYGSRLEIYYSSKNNGKYITLNSLFLKLARRDTLVFIFDADDILTPGFFKEYYFYYCTLIEKENNSKSHVMLRTMSFGIPESMILKANEIANSGQENVYKKGYDLFFEKKIKYAIPYLITHVLQLREKSWLLKFIHSLIRFQFVLEDDSTSLEMTQYELRSPHCIFFVRYNTLELLGFFNKYRVGQDTDFLKRAKLLGVKRFLNENLTPFFRRVTSNSLTADPQTSYDSPYRKKVVEENSKLIKSGVLIASGDAVKLKKKM